MASACAVGCFAIFICAAKFVREDKNRLKALEEENQRLGSEKSLADGRMRRLQADLEAKTRRLEASDRSQDTSIGSIEQQKFGRVVLHRADQVERALVFDHCEIYQTAARAFEQLNVHTSILDRRYDRCYCLSCYPLHLPDAIGNEGPTQYVVPRGWVRIGLKAPAWTEIHDVWNAWSVSFHGTNADLVKSTLEYGGFVAMPGDELPDGATLQSGGRCNGPQNRCIYTSPTIRYAGLRFYARPSPVARTRLSCQFVFQCRQDPGTSTNPAIWKQSETMGFRTRWKETLLCPHTPADEIEWVTSRRQSVQPCGLMIRTYQTFEPPSHAFRSPADHY